MGEFVPSMFADERPAGELQMLVEQTQALGANAATCILLDQSLRDYREVVGSYELPTLCTWGRDEKLVPVAAGEWVAQRPPPSSGSSSTPATAPCGRSPSSGTAASATGSPRFPASRWWVLVAATSP